MTGGGRELMSYKHSGAAAGGNDTYQGEGGESDLGVPEASNPWRTRKLSAKNIESRGKAGNEEKKR